MKNIQHYRGDALALYDAIVEAKKDVAERREILMRLKPRIKAAYEAYEKSKSKLENLSPNGNFRKEEREALSHCYDSPTDPLFKMKREVLQALPSGAIQCPYCGVGEIGHGDDDDSTGEWDHYLPRRSRPDPRKGFAEFAVHPQNLIPCCATCNKLKSDGWIDVTQRTFINMYHDHIDQSHPLIEANIDFGPRDEPKARFYYVDLPYEPFFSLFKRHCEALDLRRRYARVSLTEFATLRTIVQRCALEPSTDSILAALQAVADERAKDVGINHWKPTLYRAAARSRDFVLHCLQGTRTPGTAANNMISAASGGQGS
jgi:hypothetical protein